MNKILSVALSAYLLSPALTALADDPAHGMLTAVSVSEIFVPNGFDDNDEVMVVLDGQLPNSCYKLAHTEVNRDPETGKYFATQFARRYPGICIQATVPFFSEAHLGVMPAGSFKVATIGAAEQSLNVAEATSAGPDDFLYAPVDSVRVDQVPDSNRQFAIIEGRFTSSCMSFDDVRLVDSGRTLELLPIMKLDVRPDCQNQEVPFSWKVDLPATMTPGRHLLHVRSLNGKALNFVFTAGAL